MARPLRIEFEGAWYHVMNRGLARQRVFDSDDHRHCFLSLLAETSKRFNAEWHAYCLMGNHYHLLLRTPEGNLQRIMRHVNGLYTQYYNRSKNRDGPLFRGRYKAILVDEQSYWTGLSRYIHRNPLEAGIVKRLDRYRWSSYRAYIGKSSRPDWLVCEYILKSIAKRDVHTRYRAYVAQGVDEELVEFYSRSKQDPVLGGTEFKAALDLRSSDVDVPGLRHVRAKPTVEEIVDAVCHRIRVPEEQIWISRRGRAVTTPARSMTMYLCQALADMTLSEIATRFALKNYASAGSTIRQFRRAMAEDKILEKKVNSIKLDLTP